MLRKRGKFENKKPLKGRMKVWEEFLQWLRSKNTTSVEDFQKYFEWKWLANKKSKRLCIKKMSMDIKHVKKKAKIIVKVIMRQECEEIAQQTVGTIGAFINYRLRTIDETLFQRATGKKGPQVKLVTTSNES